MAQQQVNIHIGAPGFAGINTQQSPTALGDEWASIADNCVIDRFGRVGVRKGFEVVTTAGTAPLSGEPLKTLHVHGAIDTFSAGNGRVFRGTETLIDITPGGTITNDHWDVVSFNKRMYMFADGNDPLVYDDTTDTLTKLTDHAFFSGTAPEGDIVLGAFGRLWVAVGDIVRWSDTLNGVAWTGGSTGSVDLNTVWPNGFDVITGLAEHNNFLIIFGRKSIVIYGGADDPATMSLADTISGMGCVGKFAHASTGSDIMFLDSTGVRSLGRTIQEKSVPIGDISANVRNDIKEVTFNETDPIRLTFAVGESFLLATFPSQSQIYVFDMRGFLEDGSARTTIWPSTVLPSLDVDPSTGIMYTGTTAGISQHVNFLDAGAAIPLRYYSNPMTFDAPVNLKFLKKVNIIAIGGAGLALTLNWSYGLDKPFQKIIKGLAEGGVAEYGIAEYGESTTEFSSGIIADTIKYNTRGSGVEVIVGIECDIVGEQLSIQQLNFQALLGRMV